MVKIMENPYYKMDDLGGYPTIFGNIHYLPAFGLILATGMDLTLVPIIVWQPSLYGNHCIHPELVGGFNPNEKY